MALRKRIVRITLDMQSGNQFILTDGLDIKVRISKASLHIQNQAIIDITGLTTNMRESLLSQFTAWNRRVSRQTPNLPWEWVNVRVEAGYNDNGQENTSVIFVGQVVMCEPTSPPPTIGVRLHCFTRQIDKTRFITERAPNQLTYYDYVQWAAGQMGFGTRFICDTSYNDQIITNPARSIHTVGALLIDIQNKYRSPVAAYVDDDVLIVRDRGRILEPNNIVDITEFIGIPSWTEWGVEFVTMFNPSIKLAQGVFLTSKMNPSLNNGYVVMELEYDLASRDRPFYIKVGANPPS